MSIKKSVDIICCKFHNGQFKFSKSKIGLEMKNILHKNHMKFKLALYAHFLMHFLRKVFHLKCEISSINCSFLKHLGKLEIVKKIFYRKSVYRPSSILMGLIDIIFRIEIKARSNHKGMMYLGRVGSRPSPSSGGSTESFVQNRAYECIELNDRCSCKLVTRSLSVSFGQHRLHSVCIKPRDCPREDTSAMPKVLTSSDDQM